MADINASTDSRGLAIQGARATFFLRTTQLAGNAVDPTVVTFTITDTSGGIALSGSPDKITAGFFVLDWDVPATQNPGSYTLEWDYTISGQPSSIIQTVIVAAANAQENPPSRYFGRIADFRQSLTLMLGMAQTIPCYREPAKRSADGQTFYFTFPRWNQTAGCRIYVNKEIVTSGVSVNYDEGYIVLSEPLSSYETVAADYNFRWFQDIELERFLSNATALVNLYPPVTRGMSLMNLKDIYIPLVLWGAAVDAIRNLMMSLQFQEPQYVFGGPDQASKVYANLEGLKKNYEESLNAGLEQKKYGPYVGLTKTVITPEFALPGGRSRWFRYLFSNGTGG
jgi:hypothetical protein